LSTDINIPALPASATLLPPDEQKTLEWLAVLGAEEVPHRLVQSFGSWVIEVPQDLAEQARTAIEENERINENWPPESAKSIFPAEDEHDTWTVFGAAAFLSAAFWWFGDYVSENPYLRAGAADSVRMLDGEWWRAITALTLHADFAHVAGNCVFLIVLGYYVCRFLGGGLGLLLILATGIFGNVGVALLSKGPHLSVGASTATFGALGLLCCMSAIDAFKRTRQWKSVFARMWIPVAGGIAMLGMTGTAPGSDLGAHGLGFALGFIFMLPFPFVGSKWLPHWAQKALELFCLFVVLFAWKAAMESVG
jgi:membrane associated rhomboid family serine protease